MPPSAGKRLRFAVPASLGPRRSTVASSNLEVFLNEALGPAFRCEVSVVQSYPKLAETILDGTADFAWAPPLVCARVERAGGKALVRMIRGGTSTYRSALICHRDKPVRVGAMSGLVASWVDRDSTSGYLLAIAWLKSRGVDVDKAFRQQRFAGSFQAAINDVANGAADFSATYASPPASKRTYVGTDEVPKPVRDLISVVGYTDELPNDGIVVGPAVPASTSEYLAWKLSSVTRGATGKKMLLDVFNADSVESAPARGYAALYSLTTP